MPKSLLLFVHGLGGSPEETWGRFPDIVREDDQLKNLVDVGFYEYPTSLFRLPFSRKALRVQTLAAGLKTLIDNRFADYERLVLVCHSLGGLVARRYLLDEIKRDRVLRCTDLLLFAVPNNGAGLASVAKHVSWKHNQIRQLCGESDLIADLNEDWFTLQAPDRIRTKYIVAGQDRVVDALSAKGFWGNPDVETLPDMGHGSIVRPEGPNALAFLILKRFVERTLEGELSAADRVQAVETVAAAAAADTPSDGAAEARTGGVIFLASDAGIPLELGRELAVIRDAMSETGAELDIHERLDATRDDFLALLNRHRPQIVHFSGSMADGALVLETPDGKKDLIPESALVDVIKPFDGEVRLVFLNACNSLGCARRLVSVVDCAIGVEGAISDRAAIAYSGGFYRAIASGRSVANAHDQGLAAVKFRPVAGPHRGVAIGGDWPVADSAYSEDLPELVCARGVNPGDVVLYGRG